MGWPQYTYVALVSASIAVTILKWGKPQEGTHGWINLLGYGVGFFLLIKGGFFGCH